MIDLYDLGTATSRSVTTGGRYYVDVRRMGADYLLGGEVEQSGVIWFDRWDFARDYMLALLALAHSITTNGDSLVEIERDMAEVLATPHGDDTAAVYGRLRMNLVDADPNG